MFAVVDIAGFQEKVSKDEVLKVPHLGANVGEKVTFDKVYLVSDKDSVQLGKPVLDGTTVEAEVVEHGRDEKIRVVKFKRRKRYTRVYGHRQRYSTVKILSIGVKKAATKKPVEKKAETAEKKAPAKKPAAKKDTK